MTATAPAAAKKPQDRKSKASADDTFSFTAGGETFTSPPLLDVLTPGYIRKNRKLEEADFAFTLVESLFGDNDDAMAALDADWRLFNRVQADLTKMIQEKTQATLGE